MTQMKALLVFSLLLILVSADAASLQAADSPAVQASPSLNALPLKLAAQETAAPKQGGRPLMPLSPRFSSSTA